MSRVFVGGFPRDLEEEELKEIFGAFGQVEAVKIVRDKRTGISRRFGFVDMDNKENADLAIQNLHEGSIDEDIISVKHAVIEEPKPKPAPEKERAQRVQYGQRPQFKGKPGGGGGYGNKPNYNKQGGGGYGNKSGGYGNQGGGYRNNNNQGGGYRNNNGNQGGGYRNNNNQGGGYNNQNNGNSEGGYNNGGNYGGGYNNNPGYSRPYNKPAEEDPANSKPKRPRINRNG